MFSVQMWFTSGISPANFLGCVCCVSIAGVHFVCFPSVEHERTSSWRLRNKAGRKLWKSLEQGWVIKQHYRLRRALLWGQLLVVHSINLALMEIFVKDSNLQFISILEVDTVNLLKIVLWSDEIKLKLCKPRCTRRLHCSPCLKWYESQKTNTTYKFTPKDKPGRVAGRSCIHILETVRELRLGRIGHISFPHSHTYM